MNISKYTKQLMVAVGLLALPVAARVEKQAARNAQKPALDKPCVVPPVKMDRRTIRLTSFFSRLRCPVSNLAPEFVAVADENRLDWRLLPSISVVESGGGKTFRNNNILGWSNGAQVFPSIGSGIRTVAYKLSAGALYRGLDVRGKLMVYNPNPDYAQKVEEVMNQISPVVNLRPLRKAL